ncbi:hypothetical protein COCVIDRAFT_21320 [Bipolaris victoriae FI3]|uniref:BZIP domain-containing protein n=1 Tax=Bipolaris victoriae (strain FI3) TaxID=930091 RepID=W7E3N8_BIPV3|nr:hypothetical protein COCVIDRAFT_21320 [Bipolaris victoriae FI3]
MVAEITSPTPDASEVPGSPNSARRAKKRATDRKSQRTHRERRRTYVHSLEQKIAVLTAASSADERVATLLAENEALRIRCNDLAAQIERIRTIACEANTGNQADKESRPGRENEHQRRSPAAGTTTTAPPPLPLEAENDTRIMEYAAASPASSCAFDAAVENFDFPHDVAHPSFSNHMDETSALLQSFSNIPLQAIDNTGFYDALAVDEAAVTSYFTSSKTIALNGISEGDAPLRDSSYSLSASLPVPNYARPQGAADRLIHAMLEEARSEHQAGRFDTTSPSLARLLSQGPRDILSFRLFHYIKEYGPIPMHWMLATFWVQYLYLRWNVLRTPESYALVPEFLRPTPLECTIPHRLSINMLVWPDIRQALIRDALTVSPEDVGIELLKNLSPYWPPSFAIRGDLIASMDVFRMIETQAVQYEFWKVGKGFFDKYTQYRNCGLGPDR